MDIYHKILAGLSVLLLAAGIGLAVAMVLAREDRIRAEEKVKAEEATRAQYADQIKQIQDDEKKFHEAQAQAQSQLQNQFQSAKSPADLSALLSKFTGTPVIVNVPPATAANPNPTPVATISAPVLKQEVETCEQCKLDLRGKTQELSYSEQQRQLQMLDLQSLTKERDQWKTVARGGTGWQRFKRGVKWFVIGAAAGAAAGVAARH